mgnify:CR=1 FL=1
MTAPSTRTIACQRCGSTVPWGPYCPMCSAYLEFAGVPPWSPSPSDDLADSGVLQDGDGTVDHVSKEPERSAVDASVDDVIVEGVAQIEDLADGSSDVSSGATTDSVVPMPVVRHPSSARPTSQPGRRISARTGMVLVGVVVCVGLLGEAWLVADSGLAAFVAPFLVVTALVMAVIVWSEREAPQAEVSVESDIATDTSPATLSDPVPEVGEGVAAEVTDDHDAQGLAARAPQTIERTAKVTSVKAFTAVVRDLPCSACGHLNIARHRLCELCGEPLGDAQVKPTTAALLEARAIESPAAEARARRKRLYGSWRLSLTLLTVAAVLASSFGFVFFGPGAFRARLGTLRVYQSIVRFIAPFSGEPEPIVNVAASSNLIGSDSLHLANGDVRTFWASAPLPNFGVGSWLEFTLLHSSEIDRMVVFPGIQSGQFAVRALATPKDVTLTFDNGSQVKARLPSIDSDDQRRQLITFAPVTTSKVRVDIVSVYPPIGDEADDVGSVGISGAQFMKSPKLPTLFSINGSLE